MKKGDIIRLIGKDGQQIGPYYYVKSTRKKNIIAVHKFYHGIIQEWNTLELPKSSNYQVINTLPLAITEDKYEYLFTKYGYHVLEHEINKQCDKILSILPDVIRIYCMNRPSVYIQYERAIPLVLFNKKPFEKPLLKLRLTSVLPIY